MARKTKIDAEKTREKILEAAFDLFASKGFRGTTLNDIAATAGVTRGAIYWHFKDKVDLFVALWKEINASVQMTPEDILLDHVQSLEDLKGEVLHFLRHFEINDRYAVFWEIVSHRTEYTEELEPVLEKHRSDQRQIIQRMTRMFARLKELGRLRSDLDPTLAALNMVALVVGLIEIWLADRTAFSMAEAVPSLVDNVFLGMIA